MYLQWIYLLLLLLSSFLLSFLFERYVLSTIIKLTQKTKWQEDELLAMSFKGKTHLLITALLIGLISPYLKLGKLLAQYQQKAVVLLLVVFAILFFADFIGAIISYYSKKHSRIVPAISIINNVVRFTIIAVGILVILQTIGISITPIITTLGVGGLAIALALQDTLANLFAGMQILATQQLHPGNYIKLSTGEEGFISDITWRNTCIRTLPNNMVLIPNAKLTSAILTNYYLPDTETAVLVNIGVAYDSDLDKVEKVTMDVARQIMKTVNGGVPTFEPFIRFNTLGDFSIGFTVILRSKEFVDQYLIKHEFLKLLIKRYREESITIPFPVRTIHSEKQNG